MTMQTTHGTVYMMGFPVGEIAPGESKALDWKLEDGTEGTFKPVRLLVLFGAGDEGDKDAAAKIRKASEASCTVEVFIAGRSVTKGPVPAKQFALPDPSSGSDDSGPRTESSWPCFKAGDPLSLVVTNNGTALARVVASLKVIIEEYERVEYTTPVMSKGQAVTVVLVAPSASRIQRIEFETPTEWNPDGWALEQMYVKDMAMLMGGASFPTAAMLTLLDPVMGGARIPFVQEGAAITLALRRTGEIPVALTVRAVLDTMAGRVAQQNATSFRHYKPRRKSTDDLAPAPDTDAGNDFTPHTED
jgi:hypothetical protein